MSAEEKKKLVQSLAEAVDILPENKRDYLLGYGEGVIAMSNKSKQDGDKMS
ncbi:hypothetical protein CE91St46_13220 [Eubacteriales bacterium]|jgi:hypothetical protein|nr:hypothetical protein [Faecalicatena sp. BF-R-105]GKH50211.1 hypothetical protein CE91St46_13220 [Eubacteriales bacterium]GKH62848.1 hypothetical protein CE91St47_13170 [Eubacteriales bacterium]